MLTHALSSSRILKVNAIGQASLEELRKQSQQMDDIHTEIAVVGTKLDQSQSLQNRFDLWVNTHSLKKILLFPLTYLFVLIQAGNWFGGKKREALKEAAAEIAARNSEEHSKIKEVFEQEKFEALSRVWKPSGFALCSNPTLAAPELFDPALISSQPGESNWIVDYSLSGIDAEGWTYAYDFDTLNKKGLGEASAKWNTYVRRRKWRYHDKRGGGNAILQEVKDRNAARIGHKPVTQAEKIGYVPRSRQAGMTATGLTSAGMIGRGKKSADQDLDEDSAAGLARLKSNDQEIDDGIDKISGILDNLTGIASNMNSEVKLQAGKLDNIESGMNHTTEKQTIVNARQKKLLSSS